MLVDLKSSSDSRLATVEDKLSNLEDTMKDTVRQEVEGATSNIASSLKADLAKTVEKLVESRLKELEDRKNRNRNLIVFNLGLSKSDQPQTRKQHDLEQIKGLYTSVTTDTKELEIKALFRLTHKDKVTSCPPLKIVLALKEQRRLFLTNSKKISDLEDEDLSKVIIARDLTIDQRKTNKKIREEKDKRTKEGEDVEERFGEVIARNPQRASFSRLERRTVFLII